MNSLLIMWSSKKTPPPHKYVQGASRLDLGIHLALVFRAGLFLGDKYLI